MKVSSGVDDSSFLPFTFGSFTPAKSRNCDIEKDLIASLFAAFLPNPAPGETDISSRSVSNRTRHSTIITRSSSTLLT